MGKIEFEKTIGISEWFIKNITIRDENFKRKYFVSIALFIQDANELGLFDESKVNELIEDINKGEKRKILKEVWERKEGE